MTINERLISALAPLGLPVVPDLYDGNQLAYITFTADEMTALYADDSPWAISYSVQVDLFLPHAENSLQLRSVVQSALFAADCTWPDVMDETDEISQHYRFACEYLEAANENQG